MGRIAICIVIAVVLIPVTALAQEDEEPYSGGSVTTTTLAPRITVQAEGLVVVFDARGVSGECDWDFGDGTAGEGRPVTHTYTADGDYDVTATCGAVVLNRTLTFGSDLAFTGFEARTVLLAAALLLLVGTAMVLATRRVTAGY